MSIDALYASVLNSQGRFAAAAAAPVFLNLIMAGGVLILPSFLPVPVNEQPAYALAISVLVAGVAQFIFLASIASRNGLPVRLWWPRWTSELKEFFRRLGPALLGSGVAEISVFIDTIIASFLAAGSISYLWYADRLNQLPLAIIGIALGTVLLPRLSRLFAAGDERTASTVLSKALEVGLLFGVPSAVVFAVAAEPLVSGLFGYRRFGAEDIAGTAITLQAYAVGLTPFILVRCLVPSFYSRGDTATPVRVAAVALCINILIKILLIDPFGFNLGLFPPMNQEGIALGTSAGAIVNALLLGFLLVRRRLLHLSRDFLRRALTILGAAAAMGAALFFLPQAFANLPLAEGTMGRIMLMAAILVVGGVSYTLALVLFRYPLLRELRSALSRR
jgi:putative peptidoglycan lipid II flippase